MRDRDNRHGVGRGRAALVLGLQLSSAFPGFRDLLKRSWAEWDEMSDDEREATLVGQFLKRKDYSSRDMARINRQAEESDISDLFDLSTEFDSPRGNERDDRDDRRDRRD